MNNFNTKLVRCIDCGKQIEVSIYSNAVRCPKCKEIYKKKYELRYLTQKYKNGKFVCEVCGKSFHEDWRSPYSRQTPPRFCSKECSNRRNFSQKSKEKTSATLIKRFLKENGIEVDENMGLEILKIQSEKIHKNPKKKYRYPKNCILGKFERGEAFKRKSEILGKLGFDFEKDWEDEFF